MAGLADDLQHYSQGKARWPDAPAFFYSRSAMSAITAITLQETHYPSLPSLFYTTKTGYGNHQ
jgi:hypothetical protein